MSNPGIHDGRPAETADPARILNRVMQSRAADEAERQGLPRDVVWEDPGDGEDHFEMVITDEELGIPTAGSSASFEVGDAWGATQHAEGALEDLTTHGIREMPVEIQIAYATAQATLATAYAILAARREIEEATEHVTTQLQELNKHTDELGVALWRRRDRSTRAYRAALWIIVALMCVFAFWAGLEAR